MLILGQHAALKVVLPPSHVDSSLKQSYSLLTSQKPQLLYKTCIVGLQLVALL
jgi:hypothetical protein